MAFTQTKASPGVRKAFVLDAGAALALRVLAAVANYGSILLLAKLLPPTDYGQYGTIMSSLLLFGVICLRGNDITVTRFLGQYESHEKPGFARGLLTFSRRAVLTGSSTLLLLGLVVLGVATMIGRCDSPIPYAIALVILVPFTLMDLQSAILRSHRKMISALAPRDVFWRVVQMVLIVLVAHFLPPEKRLIPFLLLSTATITTLCLIQWRHAFQSIPHEVLTAEPEEDLPAWKTSAKANWVVMVCRASFRSLDVLVVSSVLSLTSAGLYFAASRTAELMGFALASLNTVMGPTISRAAAKNNHEELRDILGLGSLIVFLPSLFLFFVYVLFGKEILGFFGAKFVATYPVLLLLGAGQLVNAGVGSAGVALNMTGHEKVNGRILFITAPINLLLVVAFAYPWGMVGAAAASALGMVGWNIALWMAAKRHTGYDTSVLATRSFLARRLRRRSS